MQLDLDFKGAEQSGSARAGSSSHVESPVRVEGPALMESGRVHTRGAPISLADVRRRLLVAFGPFRAGRGAPAPSDLLVHALLTEADPSADVAAVAEGLKAAFGGWAALAAAPPHAIGARLAVLRLRGRPGGVEGLAGALAGGLAVVLDSDAAALASATLLDRLHAAGVSAGVATAVLARSTLARRALALDAGVLRAAVRLGLCTQSGGAALALALPEAWSAADARETHWLLRRLAETRCVGRPRCGACPLRGACARYGVAARPPQPLRPPEPPRPPGTRGFPLADGDATPRAGADAPRLFH